jgi:hypothetical protein
MYIIGALQQTILKPVDLGRYYQWAGYVVLLAIVLHPGLLTYQRFHDGFGLPPGSDLSYVASGLGWVVVLGIVSLFIFLAFELRRWFDQRGWWRYVLYANDAAMLAIFYHGLELGTQTHIGWFRAVWWFYGVTLVVALVYKYLRQLRSHKPNRR